MARGEESGLQRSQAYRVRQGGIDALCQMVTQGRIGRLGGSGGQDDAAHQMRMVGGYAAADPLTESVAQDEGAAVRKAVDHDRNVLGVIVQGQAIHRAGAAAHAARLRPQHIEAGGGEQAGDFVKILRIA
jgi:hypothetical protein